MGVVVFHMMITEQLDVLGVITKLEIVDVSGQKELFGKGEVIGCLHF